MDGIRPKQQEAALTLHRIVYLGIQGGSSHTAVDRLGRYHGGRGTRRPKESYECVGVHSYLCLRKAKEENLEEFTSRLNMINGLVQRKLLRNPNTEKMIAGDFNRIPSPFMLRYRGSVHIFTKAATKAEGRPV